MKLIIEGTHVAVEQADGQRLEFDLSKAGLTVTTKVVELVIGTDAALTLTIPFAPVQPALEDG